MKRAVFIASLFVPSLVFGQFASYNDQAFLSQSSPSSVLPTANTILWVDGVAGSKFYNSAGSSSPANGDKIAGFTDLTSNHYDLTNTGTSANMGVYTTVGGPGGKPFIQFCGNNGCLLSNAFNGTTYTQPMTIYMIFQPGTMGGVTMEAFDSFNSGVREVYFYSSGGGGTINMFAGSSASLNVSFSSAWYVVTYQFNTTSSLIRTNGVVAQSGLNPGTQGLLGFVVNNRYDGASPAAIPFTAVVINNAADSSTVMHSIETFLGNEYGITIF